MLTDLTLRVPQWNKRLEVGDSPDNAWLIAGGHVGTHLDCYLKTEIPLEYYRSPALVFDVRGIVDREITPADVDAKAIAPGRFVLFYTGWIEQHPYGTKAYAAEHPQLSEALIDLLIEREVRFIGLDCPGVRRHAGHKPADERCEAAGVYIIENLVNLGQLPGQGATVTALWMNDEDATGLRCRVVAEVADSK